MEKNREVRRGGVVGKRHVSATRRSRASSGFKYPSAVSTEDGDDMVGNNPSTSPRLQDSRSKKHAGRMSPSLQEDDSCKDLERSQNKRKRPGLQEALNHLSTSSATAAAAMDDNSDDTEMGRSEDDDDLPPPTVSRRPWKLKLHGKPREDLSPIDPAAVPRKLRTAMTKRQQESTSHLHVADIPKQRLQNDATAVSAPTSSNITVNPGRKKKPDNQKPPTAKLTKTSSSKVSKTEVEVAETLFDLARMFAAETVPLNLEKKTEPILAAKSGSASSATEPDRKRSPGASTTDVASPSSSLAQSQPGVLKKKRPRMNLKTKDEGLISVTGPCSSADPAPFLHSEKGQSQMESKASPKGGTLATPVIGLMAASSNVKAKLENSLALEAKITVTEGSSPSSMDIRSITAPSEKLTISDLAIPVNVADKNTELAETQDKRGAIQKTEPGNRPLELAPRDGDGGPVNKFEIDLMAPPQGIDKVYEFLDSNMPDVKEENQTLPNNYKGDVNLDSNMTNAMEKNEVDLATIPSAEIALADKEKKNADNSNNMELDKENKQPIENPEHDDCNICSTEKDNGIVKERKNKTDDLKDRGKHEGVEQTLTGTENNVKSDLVAHKSDLNASVKCTTTDNLRGTPVPASMAGWPAGFPRLGYYSPVAAAAAAAVAASWSTPQSVNGMSTSENSRVTPQRPSFFFPPQQSRKRCATHVYITNLIYSQQQMKSNQLWAVAYGNPTALYGNGIMGTPLSNALEPGSVVPLKEEPVGEAQTDANVQGTKEKAVNSGFDTVEIKSSQKQTQTGQKNPLMPVQNEPVFGLPVTISAAASVSGSGTGTANTAGSNILVTAAMVSGGNCASTCSSSVCSTGNGLLDGSVAAAAGLQVQLLNSPTFPFSISTGHFGSTYSGHPQQVSHVFSNSFYDAHMASQQLANTTSLSAPQKQPKNSQGSFPSFGSSQLQHQEAFTSSQAALSLSGSAPQQPKHSNEKTITTDSRSAKKQIPMVQRNMYSQKFPSVHVTSLNSQPAALAGCTPALPIHSQDFSLVANFGGKQTGKMKQQAQAQILPLQQAAAQVQKQQKPYLATQYHASAPALQTDLNEYDSKVSQSSLNRGAMGHDLMGLPGIPSFMTLQGERLQSMADLARGHTQIQKPIQNQTTSGQSHQYSMSGSHDQKMYQRQHALMERAVATTAAETGRTTNEGIYGKFGHEESQKESIKCELDQPNVFRLERESSRNIQGSQTNTDPKRASPANSTVITFSEGTAGQAVTVGRLPTGQGIHFPGPNASLVSQGLRRSHGMQDSAQMKTTIASAGSLLAAASSTPPQAMQGVTSRSQGQHSRSEQPTMNSGSISRISPAPSISSSASATSPLPSHQSVSKSGIGAPTKNSFSVKDSHSSLHKSSMASTSAKGVSAANMASVLVPGAASTLQAQLNQNQYSIQQQHQQHLRHQQTVQFMDSAQKHHGQTVLQNYPLNQNYSHQSNKHPSMQQQHLQFGQHILIHQPSLQYEVRTQSQVHSQPMSQQSTMHHQQTLQQIQQSPGQTTSLTQQRGSIQQQHLKHLQPVLTMPFGGSASGNLPHNTGTVDAGNASLSMVSDGGKTTAKLGEINITCSSSKTSCNDGPLRQHNHNSAVSSLQHVSSSNTVSVPYSNSLSQPMPSTKAVEKLSEKTNQ